MPAQSRDVDEVDHVDNDEHGDDGRVSAEVLRDEDGGLVAREARESPCGKYCAVYTKRR